MYLTAIISALFIVTIKGDILKEIERINNAQNYWTAAVNPFSFKSNRELSKLFGEKLSKNPIFPTKEVSNHKYDIPDTFDARLHWPNCPSISSIKDQGHCAACWAIASASSMEDRLCIAGAPKNPTVSAENLLSCCSYCGGCHGGSSAQAWHYFKNSGIVTGGSYHSGEGCQPYEFHPMGHNATKMNSKIKKPPCYKSCTNNKYPVSYDDDKHYGESAYYLPHRVDAIQHEILLNGPVVAAFYAYEDFVHYHKGVYVRHSNKLIGVHAVKVLGWGTENGVDYWLAANSWNTSWGHKGTFKILRGVNECKFENYVLCGRVIVNVIN